MSEKASLLRFAATAALIAAMTALSSCEDDTFDNIRAEGDGMRFDVEVTGDWSAGSRAAGDVIISEMQQDSDSDPLYLVTETFDADADTVSVSAASSVAGRGTPVTDVAGFHDSFGVSAMCYTSTPGDDFPLNFAYNLKIRKSGSTWTREDGLKLEWTKSGTLKFFAYSPHSSAFDDSRLLHSSATDTGAPVLHYTVPADAKAQTDIMTAVKVCDGDQGGAVSLTFTHALTAVTVKTGEAMLGGTVKSVTLKNVYGKGSHRIGSGKWSAQSPRDFTVSFGDEGKKLPAADKDNNNYYTGSGNEIVSGDITLMMIPQTLPADAQLEIKFTDELTGADRTLSASLAGKEWGVGKKVVYSLNSTGIVVNPVAELPDMPSDITLRAHGYLFDIALKAYAQVTQKDTPTEVVALPFKPQVSLDGGTTWSDVAWSGNSPVNVDDPINGTLHLPAQPVYTTMQSTMDCTNESGSETLYTDLSGGGETANCYVLNTPGYYSLPLIYGNARTGGVDSYRYDADKGSVPIPTTPEEEINALVLRSFVGHDDLPINGPEIPGAVDAVLVWQDAPDLVTGVRLDGGMLKFRVRKESFTQGNAIVAVRNAQKEIIWSWHIWATHYKWDGSADLHTKSRHDKDHQNAVREYAFSPCNLGYCDPHGGNASREMKLRIEFTLPDGKTKKSVTLPNVITQDEIAASIAGDNTYYQWGRKDPMLPGIYNKEIIDWAATTLLPQEYDIKNKAFFCDYPEYEFKPAQSGVSIGETIKNPHKFFMSKRPDNDDNDPNGNYLRRHWHDGRNSPYKHHAVMNFWDSQMDSMGVSGTIEKPQNERDVTKTIYDPCPPGYKIPPPNAFTMFGTKVGTASMYEDITVKDPDGNIISTEHKENVNYFGTLDEYDAIENSGRKIGWNIALGEKHTGGKIFFPATGLRDMGVKDTQTASGYNDGATPNTTISWPAHANLTFIATSGFQRSNVSSSAILFYLDNRNENQVSNTTDKNTGNVTTTIKKCTITVNGGTNNAYGFTVRPIHR